MANTAVENTVFSYLMAKPAKMLSEIYDGKNADSTVKYLKIYLKTNEVINSTRVTQQLQVMAFEEEQRKMELEQTRKEAQARLKIYFLIAGLLLVSVFGVLMFRNNKQKQKINAKLEITLSNLQATQSQLIQSEKMASLGELTAGIAHEIQNPLNFVNNFSEVSTELVDEMKSEIKKGNYNEVNVIADDVKQNLEKINHHGQRASDIVKGMLQHSRSSSGVKEPTDINALADEYFRLAYHGLRAKDKTFNATMKTDFDESIGKIDIIPQDIGRVVLNLITNAFYAVNEKSKQGIADYEPTVSVVTKKVNHQVEIRVTDNGNGIPANIVDKIFQPFFTTKPTGQGTGLGLSLSYDILKAHRGELKVETAEGEGSTFNIELPTA
jgi:signal transduction histidine kinase